MEQYRKRAHEYWKTIERKRQRMIIKGKKQINLHERLINKSNGIMKWTKLL